MDEEENHARCIICDDNDYWLEYEVTNCCQNIICISCLKKLDKYICPVCAKPFTYDFITLNSLPIFNKSLVYGNDRKQNTKITIITTEDFDESLRLKKRDSIFYRHWYQWSLSVNKHYLINVLCEELAGYWEKDYSTNEIKDIVEKLKKDDTMGELQILDDEDIKGKFNLMPDKLFIYNEHFAFMFGDKDITEHIIIDKIIEPDY